MPQNHEKRTYKSCRRNHKKGRVNKRKNDHLELQGKYIDTITGFAKREGNTTNYQAQAKKSKADDQSKWKRRQLKQKNELLNKESKATASGIKAEKQTEACPTDYAWRGMTMIKQKQSDDLDRKCKKWRDQDKR